MTTISDHIRRALREIDAAQELAEGDDLLELRAIGAELRDFNRRAIEDEAFESAPTIVDDIAARMVARAERDSDAMAAFKREANAQELGR